MRLNVNQKYSIDEPTVKKAYFVPQSEWQRVVRLINELVPYHNVFQLLWPLCVGVFGSMIGILITLRTASVAAPNWVGTVIWATAATTLVACIICFCADYQ